MPKDRERTVNPAAAHLKAQKASALKKSKAAVAAQRSERLATRNPDRLQQRVDELKGLQDAQGGELRGKEKQELEKLEKEVREIYKARQTNGPTEQERRRDDRDGGGRGGRGGGERGRGRGRGTGSMLGKRRRDDHSDEIHSSEDTDLEALDIPMPRDTPPPIPSRRFRNRHPNYDDAPHTPHALPSKPVVVAQTTYSSAPQVRDLRKEATSKFMPAAVAAKMKQVKSGGSAGDATAMGDGEPGRLLEPEEVDALEAAGYMGRGQVTKSTERSTGDIADAEDEEARFERELAELEQQEGTYENADDAMTSARHRLREASMKDISHAVDAATQEAQHRLMADESGENMRQGMSDLTPDEKAELELKRVEDEDSVLNVEGSLGYGKSEELRRMTLKDAQGAAREAVKEAEYMMMIDEAKQDFIGTTKPTTEPVVEKKLRLVEIEEVSDDEW